MAGGGFCEEDQPARPPRRLSPPLEHAKVQRNVYPLLIDQVGTVRAQTEAMVSSRIMAQVKEILVKEGDTVFSAL